MVLQKDALTFEQKNQSMTKLPKYARISKRPIPHPPTGNPYAGASVPKTVYISTKTPFMSAVKRVLNLLQQAEKRALDSSNATKAGQRQRQRQNPAQKDQGGKEGGKREEVFVKATGRAIEKALSVGRWFEKQEEKFGVRVSTGTVLVVDDVEEDEDVRKRVVEEGGRLQKQEGCVSQSQTTTDTSKQDDSQEGSNSTSAMSSAQLSTPSSAPSVSKSASKKRKRAANAAAEGELPETRTRWVNMVEVAVSLK